MSCYCNKFNIKIMYHQRLSTMPDYHTPKAYSRRNQTSNAQRMRELQALKESSLDNLNTKIRGLLDRLSKQGHHEPNPDIKQRIKTDYSDCTDSSDSSCSLGSDLSNFESFGDSMGRSGPREVALPMSIQITGVSFKRQSKKEEQLNKIRLKYKNREASRQSSVSSTHSKRSVDHYSFVKSRNYRGEPKQQRNKHYDESPLLQKFPIQPRKSSNIERKPLGDATNTYSSNSISNKMDMNVEKRWKSRAREESQPVTASFRQPPQAKEESVITTELGRLSHHLKRQVELDEQFRHCKKWFERQASAYKWVELNSQLKKRQINLDENTVRELFTLRQQEEDPFTSLRDMDSSIEELIYCFMTCEEYWFANLSRKYNQEELKSEGLAEERLDLTGKGRVDVQDLVRFGNLELELDVRVRDMFLVFERLRNNEALTYMDLLDGLCH